MIDYKELTDKQIETLLLFAQGYAIKKIAAMQMVGVGTVQQRLKRCKHKHRQAFDNACGVRNAYGRSKQAIENPISMDDQEFDKEYIPIKGTWGLTIVHPKHRPDG